MDRGVVDLQQMFLQVSRASTARQLANTGYAISLTAGLLVGTVPMWLSTNLRICA
jgi:hypothetical protein